MKRDLLLGAIGLCTVLSACNALPEYGPRTQDIWAGATTVAVNPPDTIAYSYALVDLNPAVVENAVDIDADSFYGSFGKGHRPAPEVLVGPGDVVQLTVFESKSGGLFIPADAGVRPGNFVTLPLQTVDHDGLLIVPYAGEIKAAGRTIAQIQQAIEERLEKRAIEPKVVASLADQVAGAASVVGEVNLPRKVMLTQNGERILDAIALAGGPKYPGYETFVTLQRSGRQATMFFDSLIRHPEENIYAMPGDTIYLL